MLTVSSTKNTHQKGMFWVWYYTISDYEATAGDIWGVYKTASLPLIPNSLWLGELVLFKVPSVGQMDMFENYSYSKKILEAK